MFYKRVINGPKSSQMKKLFLYSLFIVATVIPAFSQTTSSKKYDFKLNMPSIDTTLELSILEETMPSFSPLDGSTQVRKFDNLEDFLDTMKKNNGLLYTQDESPIVINTNPIYSLRIVKPGGNHPIKIYKPDSTRNYTLLIKEY